VAGSPLVGSYLVTVARFAVIFGILWAYQKGVAIMSKCISFLTIAALMVVPILISKGWANGTKDTLKKHPESTLEKLQIDKELQNAFQTFDPKLDDVPPQDRPILKSVKLKENGKDTSYHCFCTSRRNSSHQGYDEKQSFEQNASNYMYGCFLAPKAKPQELFPLGFFPTKRWMDYAYQCIDSSPGNVIIIRGEGQSYGDEGVEIRLTVAPDKKQVTNKIELPYRDPQGKEVL
jgi:hypothetical protein